MKWIKKGLIFNTDKKYDWMVSHATLPIPDKVNDNVLRIYYSTRDSEDRSHGTFIEVDIDNPKKIIYQHDKPILKPGKLGLFDDSGAMPSSIVNYKDKKYLYYIGWNLSVTVSYRNSIGIAVSEDNGLTFKKLFQGPIIDRTSYEPYFTASPFVMLDNGLWKIWYASSTGWITVKNKTEPLYNIRYAESTNGIDWIRKNIICINYKFENEANARPYIIKENGIYKMWYSYRGSIDYRTNKEQSYRLGYAESLNGLDWQRKDDEVGIDRSETGWDSLMMEYPSIYIHKERKYMFYNGNGFGKSGFGYAMSDNEI